MPRARSVLCLIAVGVALSAIACGAPPNKEMDQAQGAIDTARAAGADQYAAAEFGAAEEALKRAHEAVALRDYRLALNHAIDSRERAQTAAKEAADRKAIARVDADRAVAAATAALAEAQDQIKAAEDARTPDRILSEPRRVVADADRSVQEARAAFDRGDYGAVVTTASAATTALQGAMRELPAATATPARRRR